MSSVQIVLIEDNPADVILVKLALTENSIPFQLTHFVSGNDAVKILCDEDTEIAVPDVILMDLNTPGTNGFDALGKLARCTRLADVSLAILTSSRAANDIRQAAILGARFIVKPSQLDSFLSTVGQGVKEMLVAREHKRSSAL